jgi:hypothetical protein
MGKYEHLKERIGKFKIICRGKVIKPPDLCNLLPLIFFIIIMTFPILGFVTWSFKNYIVAICLSIFYFICILMTFGTMCYCSFSDPGIIPKHIADLKDS